MPLTPTEIADLEGRLAEAEETLAAIRNGDVDAVVVGGPSGQQVYTLENADRPYRVLIEQMQEGAVTLSGEGTVLYCNQRFATLVATPRELVIGASIRRFLSAGETAAFFELLTQRPQAGLTGEFLILAANGAAVPVNVSLTDLKVDDGMPRVVCGVVTDLTEVRKRSQELSAANERRANEQRLRQLNTMLEQRVAERTAELQASQARMRTIFETNFQLQGWLSPEGVLLDVNATALAAIDARREDVIGQAFWQTPWFTATPGIPEKIRAALRAAAHGEHVRMEFAVNVLNGLRIYDCSIQPVRNPAGEIVSLVTGAVDITERRQAEQQLRQAQKMEAVGQLTGGIAHDFNNLLMIIGGSLDMLSRRMAPDAKTMQFIDAARKGVARGAKLNQQLLAFSRRQDLRAEVVCVDHLIPTFEHLLDRALGETITVQIKPAPHPWFCRTDPHQLETAVLNLAINARDAMPGGGTLTLSTFNRTVSEAIASSAGAAAGDYVVLAVADTGAGMSADILARVFEPFFTTKAVGHGTGLGLSQVYGFVKQSDGFVAIESEPGQGTTVFIHLPRTQQAAKTAATAGTAIAAESPGYGVVLVVEDDADVRGTTSGMLRDLGYAVREAETGPAALATLEAGAAIDLVFSDVIMPDGMSGIELARELGQRRPGLPVLLTSGYTAQRLVPEALAGGWHLLRKPYTLVELSQAVGKAMQWPHAH